jgi:opacity protein-like surface antigen
MRRMIQIGLVLLMVSSVLGAQQERDSFSMVLGRFGYFLASDSAFKVIYGNGAVYGGELRLGGKRIVGWLEGSYRERAGKLSFTGEKTKVKVTGIEVGALYRIIPGNISPYAGASIGYYMFNENNKPMGVAKQSKIGFCGAAGVSVIVAKRFVLDCRLKYTACSIKPAEFRINIGGLGLSLGMGVRF